MSRRPLALPFALACALTLAGCSEEMPDLTGPIEGWSAYGNDAGGSRFSLQPLQFAFEERPIVLTAQVRLREIGRAHV